MQPDILKSLWERFEGASHTTEDGLTFWSARDLQTLLGYERWENFSTAIQRAKDSCAAGGHKVDDHFRDLTKMVQVGSGAEREIEDVILTRYACYLLAQNGDPRKEAIAFAQNYFAVQTRKQELIEQRLHEHERLEARAKLTQTEKELSSVLYERGVDDKGFAIIRSRGDMALFGGHNTQQMKTRLGIGDGRPVADFLPTVTLKAKEFAAAITSHNVREHNLTGEMPIGNEHVKNNRSVRNTLLERGIRPESLPAAEDIKKLERRHKSEPEKLTKSEKAFNKLQESKK
jgi:DNA-damage-inducible protein D